MAPSSVARALRRALSTCRRSIALALLLSLVAVPCAASEIIVKNDSMPPAGNPLPEAQAGFRFGVWHEAPIDGTIVGVQILWGSSSGGAAPAQHVAIRISPFDLQAFSTGSPWATIDSPVLLDSGINEFRYLDPSSNLQPLAVSVSAGELFMIDLELGSQERGDPSILMDVDGQTSFHRNLLKIPNVIWRSALLSIPGAGDLGIRAIIQPVPEPASVILLGVGAIGAVIAARRGRKLRSPT